MQDSRLPTYTQIWQDYLDRLEEVTPVAADVRKLWSSFETRLWAPEAAPTAEGFRLAWDRGPHHLQIEVRPAGLFDWFYRDRDADSSKFEEDLPLDQPSEALETVISRLAAA